MVEIEKNQMHKIAHLFASTQETMVRSCLDGSMGRAWADDPDRPACAKTVTGDFCFLAGDPSCSQARAFASNFAPEYHGKELIIVPQNEAWAQILRDCLGDYIEKTVRYAFKKEPDCFDTALLCRFAAEIPQGYTIKPIDETLFKQARTSSDFTDLCSQFESWSDYSLRGKGFCALKQGDIVSGASSYTVYRGGIEIQVDTLPAHRRKGLARACCARLMLACLKAGLYPSWDAANMESVYLAQSLGYHLAFAYEAYDVNLPSF